MGGKVSSETGEVYRQSATFPGGTWPNANGYDVPWFNHIYLSDNSVKAYIIKENAEKWDDEEKYLIF